MDYSPSYPVGEIEVCKSKEAESRSRSIQKTPQNYLRKQALAHVKATWVLFQQISADTKGLDEIPHSLTQASTATCR